MDEKTIEQLKQLNNVFYEVNAASFSQSRQSGWPGWERVVSALNDLSLATCGNTHKSSLSLLDVACGNMRFEKYVEETSEFPFRFTCIDSCPDLASHASLYQYVSFDMIDALLAHKTLKDTFGLFDGAVSFGFMHHIPSFELRRQFLHELIGSVRSGGLVAVSMWQFMNNNTLAKKAYLTTSQGQARYHFDLEKHDYLIGWNGNTDTFRYCHHFCEEEIEHVCDLCAPYAQIIDRYQSDGRDGRLNAYLIMRVR